MFLPGDLLFCSHLVEPESTPVQRRARFHVLKICTETHGGDTWNWLTNRVEVRRSGGQICYRNNPKPYLQAIILVEKEPRALERSYVVVVVYVRDVRFCF